MEMSFFDTFSVIALWVGETKQALLEEVTNIVRTDTKAIQSTHSSSFQKVKAMFCQPCVSETPAIPSSPHLKARDRAWSWGKSGGTISKECALVRWKQLSSTYGSRRLRRGYNLRELYAGQQWPLQESVARGVIAAYQSPIVAQRRRGPISSSTWFDRDPLSSVSPLR